MTKTERIAQAVIALYHSLQAQPPSHVKPNDIITLLYQANYLAWRVPTLSNIDPQLYVDLVNEVRKLAFLAIGLDEEGHTPA
jgi:hypothetical protein